MNKLHSVNQRNFANQLQLSYKTVLPAMTEPVNWIYKGNSKSKQLRIFVCKQWMINR